MLRSVNGDFGGTAMNLAQFEKAPCYQGRELTCNINVSINKEFQGLH